MVVSNEQEYGELASVQIVVHVEPPAVVRWIATVAIPEAGSVAVPASEIVPRSGEPGSVIVPVAGIVLSIQRLVRGVVVVVKPALSVMRMRRSICRSVSAVVSNEQE